MRFRPSRKLFVLTMYWPPVSSAMYMTDECTLSLATESMFDENAMPCMEASRELMPIGPAATTV